LNGFERRRDAEHPKVAVEGAAQLTSHRTSDHKVNERGPFSLSGKVSGTLETVLKAKLHRLVVTETDLDYEGSIEIGAELMEAAGIRPYEQVLIANFTNGSRAWTYAIPHKRGQVRLNGGTARMGLKGDVVTVFAFVHIEAGEEFHPKIVFVGKKNSIRKVEKR